MKDQKDEIVALVKAGFAPIEAEGRIGERA